MEHISEFGNSIPYYFTSLRTFLSALNIALSKDSSLEHGTFAQEQHINKFLHGPESNDFFSKCM